MARRGAAAAITAEYTARIRLGIEVEDDGLPAQAAQRDVCAVLVGQRELRGLLADFDHRFRLRVEIRDL
jgi:hypothetical protein